MQTLKLAALMAVAATAAAQCNPGQTAVKQAGENCQLCVCDDEAQWVCDDVDVQVCAEGARRSATAMAVTDLTSSTNGTNGTNATNTTVTPSPTEVTPTPDVYKCTSDFECQALGDDAGKCNLATGRCECGPGFGPTEVKGKMLYVCYNANYKELVEVEFIATYKHATCPKIKAAGFDVEDFENEVTKWLASEKIVDTSKLAPLSFGFCFNDSPLITWSMAAVDIFPLILLAISNGELAGDILNAIDTDDLAGNLKTFLLKTEVGQVILARAAARAAGVLASPEEIALKLQKAGTGNGKTCVIQNAKTVRAFTVNGKDLCFATSCNNGYKLVTTGTNGAGAGGTCQKIASVPAITNSPPTTSPPTTNSTNSTVAVQSRVGGAINGDDDLSSGAIAAIVLGCLFLVGVVVAAAVVLTGKPAKAAEVPANEPIDGAEGV